jgi:hypothetical protein
MTLFYRLTSMTLFYRLILLNLFCLASALGIGQIEKLELQWQDEVLIVEGDTTYVQNCSYCALDDDQEPYLVYSINEKIDSVWIDKVEGDFLLGYNPGNYSSLNLTRETVISGDKEITNLRIPANYVQDGQVKKITSVSIAYSTPSVFQTARFSRKKKGASYASESKLKSGSWYKLEVNKDGVYKLDASYLSSLGIDIANVDGAKIKVFGSGNAMLPQINNLERADDLVENAIFVSTDGDFSSSDYVLFYGQSPHKLVLDTTNKLIHHEINLYTNSSYYFLTVDGEDGLRLGERNDEGTASLSVTTSDEYVFLEEDKINSLHSGRSWYGDHFDTYKEHSYTISTPDKVDNSAFRYQSAVMARAYSSEVSFTTTLNGSVLGSQIVPKNAINSAYYGVTGYDKVTDFDLSYSDYGNSNTFDVKIGFTGDASSSRNDGGQTHGYVNYFGIQYERSLATSTKQVVFRNFQSLNQEITKYQLGVSSAFTVWDITAPLYPQKVLLTNSDDTRSFIEKSNSLKQYVLFSNSGFLLPKSSRKIANQNLHGITSVPNLVIITHEGIRGWAQTYADYRNKNGLSYLLVTPEEIYNEFSSGAQDVSAIRDFLKMLYDRDQNAFKYAVLFGGASYDYKDVVENNTNHVPVYQSLESIHNVKTYASDDYYGFLTDGDGEWAETYSGNHEMVISVGRMLARNNEEAETMVNKVIHYENSSAVSGEWMRNISLLADDGDGNLHTKDADKLSEIINREYPSIKIDRLFLDDYEQVSSGWGASAAYNEAYDRVVDKGALIVNYTGHGAAFQLASEAMMTIPKINAMTNYDKLSLYVTATCEVGRFEDPSLTTSIIYSLLHNNNGGAIATITTTRPVYASSNFKINKAFYENVFQRRENGEYSTLGEVFRVTKNESLSGVNNRNFSLLGDPCLKFNLPSNKLVINEMNDNKIISEIDTLKALMEVVFKGEVTDGLGNAIPDFNGVLAVSVYDKEVDRKTLGSVDSPYSYKEWSNFLFDGEVAVTDGTFQIKFTVPKDISYGYDFGKINMYAFTDDKTKEAMGYHSNLRIGGTVSVLGIDDTPPSANLFMDDETFVDGGRTASTTLFIAELFDDHGINLTNTSVGHEITLVVDGDSDNLKVLNSYYTSDLGGYQSGRIEYQLKNLTDGEHHLKLTAWDTHNNSVIEELKFIVGSNDVESYVYPNPFIDETTIFIDHGRAGERISVEVVIVDDKGSEMLKAVYEYQDADNVIDNIVWDGTFNGTKVQSGLYFMKVKLYYPKTGTSISKIHKVVLLD